MVVLLMTEHLTTQEASPQQPVFFCSAFGQFLQSICFITCFIGHAAEFEAKAEKPCPITDRQNNTSRQRLIIIMG